MNNKNYIIGGLIIVILGYFGFQSYQSIENQKTKYETENSNNFDNNRNYKKSLSNESYTDSNNSGNDKPIFKFTSNSNDLENEAVILQTTNETSYHTFDFNKNLISFKSLDKNGKWTTFDFKIKKSTINESISGLKGMEFAIDNPKCFQVWVSSVGNIGYEFKNGQKLVFYGIQEIR